MATENGVELLVLCDARNHHDSDCSGRRRLAGVRIFDDSSRHRRHVLAPMDSGSLDRVGVGSVACVLGVIGSYTTDSPYGPTILLVMGLFFVLALVISMLLTRRKTVAHGVLPDIAIQTGPEGAQ